MLVQRRYDHSRPWTTLSCIVTPRPVDQARLGWDGTFGSALPPFVQHPESSFSPNTPACMHAKCWYESPRVSSQTSYIVCIPELPNAPVA